MDQDIRMLDHIALYEAVPTHPDKAVTYFLLHGIGTSLDFWVAVAPLLAAHDRTIAIDIPGFGRSSVPQGGLTLESAASQICSLSESLNITNGILVAHSLGAFVAVRLAALIPERFNRVILVDGTLKRALEVLQHPERIFTEPLLGINVSVQIIAAILPLKKQIAELMGHSSLLRSLTLWPWIDKPSRIEPSIISAALSNNGGFRAVSSIISARHMDYGHLLQQVSQPVDLVWGANDHLIDADDVEYAKRHLNVDRSMAIANCGHWPMIEFPSQLADFIIAWGESSAASDTHYRL